MDIPDGAEIVLKVRSYTVALQGERGSFKAQKRLIEMAHNFLRKKYIPLSDVTVKAGYRDADSPHADDSGNVWPQSASWPAWEPDLLDRVTDHLIGWYGAPDAFWDEIPKDERGRKLLCLTIEVAQGVQIPFMLPNELAYAEVRTP